MVLRKHSSVGQLSENEQTLHLFLPQTAALCFVDFLCWTPSIVLGEMLSFCSGTSFFNELRDTNAQKATGVLGTSSTWGGGSLGGG